MAFGSLSEILDTLCSGVAKLHLAPSRTLSNPWRHERLRMLEKAATAILQEPTRIITKTKGHHALRLEGQFEHCDESEEEAVLLEGQFRRMKISVRNLDKLPRTYGRATLRRVRQALIPYRSKPVVFKLSVGQAFCGALFNLRDVVEQRVKLHYMQQPQGRVPSKFQLSFMWMPPLFGREVPHVGTCTSTEQIVHAPRGGPVCGPRGLRSMD